MLEMYALQAVSLLIRVCRAVFVVQGFDSIPSDGKHDQIGSEVLDWTLQRFKPRN